MKNYPDYETLCEEYQSGNISAVDFVTQQSDEMTQEYYDFCKDEPLTIIQKQQPRLSWITAKPCLKRV